MSVYIIFLNKKKFKMINFIRKKNYTLFIHHCFSRLSLNSIKIYLYKYAFFSKKTLKKTNKNSIKF